MEIREGYKKTDCGIIPEEWEIKTIGQLGAFSKGQGIKKDEAQSGNIPCVRYGELYTLHNEYIKFFGSFISSEVSRTSKKLRKGDILFAGSGETKEEIGKCAAFTHDFEAYVGGDVVILSPKYGNSLFYGFLFNLPLVARQKANKGQGDAVVHISVSSLSSILVPIPPPPEQQAIATALSDIDNLISSLTKLIEKKKNIKQGAMQELLTGRKRLEGFSGEWIEKSIDELVYFENGKAHENSIIENGKYVVVNSKFISTNGQIKKFSSQPYMLAKRTDILMVMSDVPNGRAIAKCYIVEKDNLYTVNQRVCKLCYKNSDMKFLFYKLDRNSYFLSFDDGVKQTNLSKKDILSCCIKIPPSIEEQTAIANILSDMDAEIEVLEQKLNKYKDIKQGMMQELLTGRIRLLEEVV